MKLASTDAAYIAGFLDGEGSIMLYRRKDRGKVELRITATNTHREILEWIMSTTGCGSIIAQGQPNPDKHYPAWHWRIKPSDCVALLEVVRPYLRLKASQADLAMEFQQRSDTEGNGLWQEDYRERMAALNRSKWR
jgi:hypothetical protein